MSATATTITELNELAKDYYSDVYIKTYNADTPLKAQFAKLENAIFTGRKFIFGVKTAVGGGSANGAALKSLPPADEGKYDQGEANVIRTYTRMAIDSLLIEVTKKQAGSYRPALAETMADRLEAHDLEVNRQLFCAGKGDLARISAGANSATQAVDRDYGDANGGLGVRHVNEGDMLAIYDSTLVTLRGRVTVTSVDYAASTFVADGAVNTTTGDRIARSTSDTDNFATGEVNGLLASTVQTGTFEAIPVAGRWKAINHNNGGTIRPLEDGELVETIVEMRTKSRKLPNLAVARPGVSLKYSESFLPLRRIDGQDVQLKGGFKPVAAIQHAGGIVPVLEDPDCPGNRIFLLNTEAARFADLVGTEWFAQDGAQFLRQTDKDSIEGFIRKYWQVIWVQLNCIAVIADVEDVSTIERVS